jgi:putative ATPase subunit gpP of terminase
MDLFAEFEWSVGGVSLVNVLPDDHTSVPALVATTDSPPRFYRPLTPEHSTLWRTFARRDATPDECLALAREYGLLGESQELPIADQPERSVTAESMWCWNGELSDLAFADFLLQHIVAEESAAFEPLFEWDGDHVCTVEYVHEQELLPGFAAVRVGGDGNGTRRRTELAGPTFTSHWTPGDLVKPAQLYLQRVVTRHLAERVSTSLAFSSNHRHQRLVYGPTSLLGALWLQVALAIASDATMGSCKECGRPFEISRSPMGLRVDAEFCTNACKSRQYRKRKRRAKRLFREGYGIVEIASLIDTSPATVRRWVEKHPST